MTPSSLIFRRCCDHLKSAAVGQDRAIPGVETVQSAGLVQYIEAGAEVEVIGVPEDDLGMDVVGELVLVHGFYRRGRADGHKYRRLDGAVGSFQQAGAGIRLSVSMLKGEGHF